MAKSSKAKNGINKEFHGKGPGNKGQPAPSVAGKHKAGDSRSKTMMKGISPQKGC